MAPVKVKKICCSAYFLPTRRPIALIANVHTARQLVPVTSVSDLSIPLALFSPRRVDVCYRRRSPGPLASTINYQARHPSTRR